MTYLDTYQISVLLTLIQIQQFQFILPVAALDNKYYRTTPTSVGRRQRSG